MLIDWCRVAGPEVVTRRVEVSRRRPWLRCATQREPAWWVEDRTATPPDPGGVHHDIQIDTRRHTRYISLMWHRPTEMLHGWRQWWFGWSSGGTEIRKSTLVLLGWWLDIERRPAE